SSMAGLRYPSHGRSRQSGHPVRPSAEGRSNWLNFPRKVLVFSIPNRFYPSTLHPLSLHQYLNIDCLSRSWGLASDNTTVARRLSVS
ncbi:MAG TPA: hypothetical protein PLY87_12200, partial [Planctomycetaceae bacterium]|nr:hypothetical protein [Planctomycetaceae bacterium]